MEDLDEKPSKFHDLNNSLHLIAGQVGVINQRLESNGQQANRIETGITALDSRLVRFEDRLTSMEKRQIEDKGASLAHIAQVKGELERQVWDVTTSLKTSMEQLSPIRLIVYGAAVMILTAVFNLWITRAWSPEPARLAPASQHP